MVKVRLSQNCPESQLNLGGIVLTKGNDFELFFPKLPPNVLKTISNKRWQLDTLLH